MAQPNPDGTINCVAGCQRPKYCRGLCSRCYNRIAERVAMKETTWAAEEKAGRCEGKRPVNRRFGNRYAGPGDVAGG